MKGLVCEPKISLTGIFPSEKQTNQARDKGVEAPQVGLFRTKL